MSNPLINALAKEKIPCENNAAYNAPIDGKTNGPQIAWPKGKRIAVMLTFDFDAEYLRMSRAKSKGTAIGFTDFSRGQYGPYEGLSRCLDMLDTFGVKGTFFVPGIVAEQYRDCVCAIHARGHELAYHGYRHESERGISLKEEETRMEKCEEILASITGKKPVGHRGPESIIHPFTPKLLARRGDLYSSSMKDRDWAYLWEQDGKAIPLVELPCDVMMDDFTYYYFTFSDPAVRAMYANREVMGNWKDEFDGLAEERDKIFILKLHPQLIGRGCRIAALGELIAYMQRHGAWIATCEEVARYVLDHPAGKMAEEPAENTEISEKPSKQTRPDSQAETLPGQDLFTKAETLPGQDLSVKAQTLPGQSFSSPAKAPSWELPFIPLYPVWPKGKRIAVMLAFDLDAETMWTTRGDGNADHITNLSRGAYGPKQGIPRILKLLDTWNLKATFFIPGVIAESYPQVIREISRRGHEIGFHGYLHEEFTTTTYEEEHATMVRAEKIIYDICGQRLAGHRAPGGVIHDYSLKLLLEHGYCYSSNWRDSDGPFIHKLDGAEVPLIELTKDSIFDDTAYDFYTDSAPERYELKSPREMLEIWKDEFDALALEGRMMNFVLHPQFMGRASRVHMLSEFIGYALARGAWFDTNYNVASYLLEQQGYTMQDGRFLPKKG